MSYAMNIRRLHPGDDALARDMFASMAEVFEAGGDEAEQARPLTVADVRSLLSREDFWAVVATEGGSVLGGLTAHALPMTRSRSTELFIYDIAVRRDRQRQGVGRALVGELRSLARAAGIATTFVLADNEDAHALAFYRAVDGAPSEVTLFAFAG